MGVGVQVGEEVREIGTAGFLHAFFSTISRNLEPEGWGSRFPVLVNHLYRGLIPPPLVDAAVIELAQVREELGRFPPAAVVWDIENPLARPPWRDDIAPEITSLARYFVTSDGEDLLELLSEALTDARRHGSSVAIVPY